MIGTAAYEEMHGLVRGIQVASPVTAAIGLPKGFVRPRKWRGIETMGIMVKRMIKRWTSYRLQRNDGLDPRITDG